MHACMCIHYMSYVYIRIYLSIYIRMYVHIPTCIDMYTIYTYTCMFMLIGISVDVQWEVDLSLAYRASQRQYFENLTVLARIARQLSEKPLAFQRPNPNSPVTYI